jgi:hypothetical protein
LLLTQRALLAAEVETVWKSSPRPLRVTTPPGKLPRAQTWFNLETAEIAPGHTQDVLQATIGGFPADSDAVLVHVMTWNGAAQGPSRQHWSLLDAHLRALPMTALRSLRRISLLYVAYRHPAHTQMVYTLREENTGSTSTREFADAIPSDGSDASLVWGTHKFTVASGATRVRFLLGRTTAGATLQASGPSAASRRHFRADSYKYQPPPGKAVFAFDYYPRPFRDNKNDDGLQFPRTPQWMSSTARAASLGADYSVSSTTGLLLAGDGEAYQPVYTAWVTAGFGPPTARVYGGLVTQTMMVFHGSINNMNWGTSYGAGAGVHFEWQNKY